MSRKWIKTVGGREGGREGMVDIVRETTRPKSTPPRLLLTQGIKKGVEAVVRRLLGPQNPPQPLSFLSPRAELGRNLNDYIRFGQVD